MKCLLFSLIITAFVVTNVQAGSVSTSEMQPFPTTDNLPAAGDYSMLIRRGAAMRIHVNTSGLDTSSPYTVWAVIFNYPRYCLSAPCTGADLPVSAGHDPRVEASIVYVGGGLSDADGLGDFVGRVYPTSKGIATEHLFGHGLLEPRHAEIHVVVRGHGYPQAEDMFSAIGSFAGGCNAENTHQPACEDQQFAIHLGQ